jgi:hypothetical protein
MNTKNSWYQTMLGYIVEFFNPEPWRGLSKTSSPYWTWAIWKKKKKKKLKILGQAYLYSNFYPSLWSAQSAIKRLGSETVVPAELSPP